MEKEIIEIIKNELKKVQLIPFNWELATYGINNPDWCDDQFNGFRISDRDYLISSLQILKVIPEGIKENILLRNSPAFIVPMGEDSMAQLIGYPKTSSTFYNSPSRVSRCFFGLSEFGHNSIMIEQCEPCANVSIGLFSIKDYQLAQYFSLNPYNGPSGWKFDKFSEEDYKKYGEEILGIKFSIY